MSENDEENNVAASLTEDEINEFIREKGIRTTCGECGHAHIALSIKRNGFTPSLISLDEVDTRLSHAYVNFYFQLVCLNCSHLRMFEKGEVVKWKIAKGGR